MTDAVQTLGSALGLGLLAGVRLYGTVLALGLMIRYGVIDLSERLQGLAVLADGRVLAVAALAFLAEFFADKIPWVDSAWDAVHTFIRPVGAAVLGMAALGSVDPTMQMIAGLLAGGVALSGHTSKAATRYMVNHSPEPFSNVALSLLGDLAVPAGVWVAMEHPIAALTAVGIFLLVFAWAAPKLFRLLKVEWVAVKSLFGRHAEIVPELPPLPTDNLRRVLSHVERRFTPLPERYAGAVERAAGWRPSAGLRSAAGPGVRGLRGSTGWLCAGTSEWAFVARRWWRTRVHTVSISDIKEARLRRGFLVDQFILDLDGRTETYDLFKRGWRSEHAEEMPHGTAPAGGWAR